MDLHNRYLDRYGSGNSRPAGHRCSNQRGSWINLQCANGSCNDHRWINLMGWDNGSSRHSYLFRNNSNVYTDNSPGSRPYLYYQVNRGKRLKWYYACRYELDIYYRYRCIFRSSGRRSVSYTHLTLPTIYSV